MNNHLEHKNLFQKLQLQDHFLFFGLLNPERIQLVTQLKTLPIFFHHLRKHKPHIQSLKTLSSYLHGPVPISNKENHLEYLQLYFSKIYLRHLTCTHKVYNPQICDYLITHKLCQGQTNLLLYHLQKNPLVHLVIFLR